MGRPAANPPSRRSLPFVRRLNGIELFHNQQPQSFVYAKEIQQIHVDSVRAIVRTLMEQAVTDLEVSVDLGRATVGYLVDPLEVGGASPMAFFEELDPFLDVPLRPIEPAEFGDPEVPDPLEGLDTLVVTSDAAIDDPEVAAAMEPFVEGGGNLVLTDGGLRWLALVDDGIGDADVTSTNTRISNVSFEDLDHPMAENVRENALHLYEPATLGYNSETADQSPVWRVNRSAFDEGGTTLGTTGGETSVGVRPVGEDGSVHVIGGLLPPPTLQNPVVFGLNDYAVTDTGMFLFLNSIGGELIVDEEEPASLDTASGAFEPAAGGRR